MADGAMPLDAGRVPNRTPPPLDQIVVAMETADADALRQLADWSALPVFASGRTSEQSSHDRGAPNEADEAALLPLLGNGNRDVNNFQCKSADAQLSSSNLITYQFDQPSCADPYVHGAVLARYEGSGRLVRFWMTALSLQLPYVNFGDELLRVYVDDDPYPVVQAPLGQIMSGQAGEIFAPPFGAGSRAFIAWYYPVVFGHKLVIALDHLVSEYFYQSDVVFDSAPPTEPRVAPLQPAPQRDRALAQLGAATPVASDASALQVEHFMLARGEQRAVQLTGPATIEESSLRVARDQLANLAGVTVAVRWDAAADAAIDLKLLDLFVARRTPVAANNLALAATTDGTDQVLSLRLPMPFASSAEWTLQNTGDASVEFQLQWVGRKQVPSAEFGHLQVQHREVAIPAQQLETDLARATGRGRYAGVCVEVAGHADQAVAPLMAAALNLLEGDVRATIDGEPALNGTGTEDYADNSFYFLDSPKATPFAQNWGLVSGGVDQPTGQVSFCRWNVLGTTIDFQSQLQVTAEIAQRDPSVVELYRTTAYLYLP